MYLVKKLFSNQDEFHCERNAEVRPSPARLVRLVGRAEPAIPARGGLRRHKQNHLVSAPHRCHGLQHPLQLGRGSHLGRRQGSVTHLPRHWLCKRQSLGSSQESKKGLQRHSWAHRRGRETRQKTSSPRWGSRRAPRHAVDAFLGALDQTLVAEVQKLEHRTMEEVVAAARRIEKILEEQTDAKMEHLVSTM